MRLRTIINFVSYQAIHVPFESRNNIAGVSPDGNKKAERNRTSRTVRGTREETASPVSVKPLEPNA